MDDMRRVRWLMAGMAFGLLAPTAYAFQERGTSAPPVADQGPGSAPKSVTLDNPDTPKPNASGSEIRVPGLGRIGVLPKLDFGLELLYGAGAGGEPPRQQPDQRHDPNNELQVRGVIKHKF